MEEFITACPRNCYSTCSFRVQVENNVIRRILPYPGNLATPEGPCIKGISYIERTHSADRIIFPLRKTSSGTFEKIPIEDALDLAAEKLETIRKRYGSHGILWYKGSGMSGLVNDIGSVFWKKFGGVTTTYGNLCWPAGLEAVRLTLGEVKHNVPWDIENAKTIIVWGKNPAETNIQEMIFISRAREKGARVIVIDSRRTPTADKADLLISPRPGTDGALALAMAGIIIRENLTDNVFIQKNVHGFPEFCDSLDITPEMAAGITGIPAVKIIEIARLIAIEGPVTIIPGYGLQRHSNGGQTIRSLLSLSVITGNIGKPGAGFNYANLQSYVFDDVKEPLSYYPDPEADKPFRRDVSMTRLGTDMMAVKDPPVKAAWIERGNPLIQSPDSENVIRAFSGLEWLVVVEQFMTDTAAMADLILPAKDLFEQSDILGSYWSPYVSFKPKILESPGEVMPESEIYYHISRRLGMEIPPDVLPEPGNINIERWLESRIKGYSYLSLDDLRNGPVLAPGLQEIAWSDLRFPTKSGRIELLSSEAHERWSVSPLPDFHNISTDDSGIIYPLCFITPNSAARIHSQFGNLEIIGLTTEKPAAYMSPQDGRLRKIRSGDSIRIFNTSGELTTSVEISGRIPAGMVVLCNGLWLKEGGGGNRLIDCKSTDMGFGAAFHDTMVEVEKAG